MADAPIDAQQTPRPAMGGVSWFPRLQLQMYQLIGPVYIIAQSSDPVPLLGLNPDRQMFTVEASGNLCAFTLYPSTGASAAGKPVSTRDLPLRVHAAEWPCLCQGEWSVYAPDATGGTPVQFTVWEVVHKY